jgi:hypothetical protein
VSESLDNSAIPASHLNPQGRPDPPLAPEVYEAYAKNPIPPRRCETGHQHVILSRLNLNNCIKAATKICETDTDIFIVRQSDGAVVWDRGCAIDPDAALDTRDDTVDDASL